jgi:ubiquinone/menaquinone biosynthesis C-methylase UbiE
LTPKEGNESRERTRAVWSSGNYAAVAETIAGAAEVLVERAGVEPGMEVLDVATGTGNVSLPAARLGTRVTGLDLVPELIDIARERIADAGFEVDWVEGDAEELPFGAGSFDRVLSAFGHMFAPDHERTAAELVRVCRPGGVIGFCCWTPEGIAGRLHDATERHVATPSPFQQSPLLWGTEDHVRDLLARSVSELEFERRVITLRDESAEAWTAFLEDSAGPFVAVKAALGERYPELRSELVAIFEDANEADDGTLRFEQEYLLTVARL